MPLVSGALDRGWSWVEPLYEGRSAVGIGYLAFTATKPPPVGELEARSPLLGCLE